MHYVSSCGTVSKKRNTMKKTIIIITLLFSSLLSATETFQQADTNTTNTVTPELWAKQEAYLTKLPSQTIKTNNMQLQSQY